MFGRWPLAVLRLRREAKTRIGSFVLIVLVVGLAAGLAMAAVAGARRSEAAYGRFLEWSDHPELTFGGCECTAEQLYGEFDRIGAQSFVEDSARFGFASVGAELADGSRPSFLALLPVIDLDGRLGSELPRAKLLEGRLVDPSRVDEVTLSFVAAERFGLEVGDELQLQPLDEGGLDLPTVQIVGIHAVPGELPSVSGPGGSSLLLTRRFGERFPEVADRVDDSLFVRTRPDADPAAIDTFIDSLRYDLDVDRSAEATAGIERTIGVESGAVVLLSVVVGFVGLVVAGQMLRRHVDVDGVERLTWSAIGWDRGDTVRLAILRGVSFGAAVAVLAVAVAVGLSPRFPVGIGRIADPDVGWHADSRALVGGATVTMLAVMALTLAATARRPQRPQAGDVGVRGVAPALAVSHKPSVVVGLHFSRSDIGRSAPVSMTSLLSLIVGLIALTATIIAVASVDHLTDRRDLAGATWDAAILTPLDGAGHPDIDDAMARVGPVPGVAGATPGGWLSGGLDGEKLLLDGLPVEAQVFGDDHSIQPAIRTGRAPSSTGEVALGGAVMRELDLGIGDGVLLSSTAGGSTVPGRVVGEVVLASPYFTTFSPGQGAAIEASTYRALGGSDLASAVVLVRYDRDANELETFNRVEDALGTNDAFEASDRQGTTGLDRVRVVPVLLIAGLLALVAAALGHVLLVSVGTHRRDLAVLSALGMTDRQLSASVVVHGTIVATVACVVGVPLGVMVGRLTWTEIASYVIVVNRPIVPVMFLGLLAAVLVTVALAATYLPARQARRLRPATVLRTF